MMEGAGMKQFKRCLKKCPLLYGIIRKACILFVSRYMRFKEYLSRYRRDRVWAIRHLREGNDWIKECWDSRNTPHRHFLVEKIANFSPISSILEIGCSCGPNLYLLAKKFPKAKIRGMDINPLAVQEGNELFKNEGILNVELSVGRADGLNRFPGKSFDVVFTYSVLIYVSPDKVKKVIEEMLRVSRQALILVEWHNFAPNKDPYALGVYDYNLGYWIRDYIALLKRFVEEKQINVIKIPEEIWPEPGWKKFGAVIEVNIDR